MYVKMLLYSTNYEGFKMAGLIDTIYTLRFIKILSTKWQNTDAYKLGIIDENGKPLKKSKDFTTTEEKKAYTPFVRLIFKLKRLMGTIPGGKSAVARYGAAIALIKEHSKEVEEMGINLQRLEEGLKKYIDGETVNEAPTNVTGGIEGKEQPLGKKGKIKKRKKKKKEDDVIDKNNTEDKNEEIFHTYQMIGNTLVRVDEIKRRIKKRIVKGKRQKKREYVPTKRRTRTGKRKLRGGQKAKWKRSHKKAYRKAHTGAAKHKRKRSMRKSRKYSKRK